MQVLVYQQNMVGGAERKVAVIAYDLTDQGKAAYSKDAGPSTMGGNETVYVTANRTLTR